MASLLQVASSVIDVPLSRYEELILLEEKYYQIYENILKADEGYEGYEGVLKLLEIIDSTTYDIVVDEIFNTDELECEGNNGN